MDKIIKKVGAKRGVFSEFVLVKNGFLKTSDLDTSVYLYTDLEDGAYYLDLAKKGIFRKADSEEDLDDIFDEGFPEEYRQVPTEDIEHLLKAVEFTSKPSDGRPVFEGVYISEKFICGTNALRLYHSFKDRPHFSFKAIVRKKVFEVIKLLKKEPWGVSYKDEKIYFRYPKGLIVSRCIPGVYPHVGSVIPTSWRYSFKVSSKSLRSTVRKLKPFLNKDSAIVHLEASGDTLKVTARDKDRDLKETLTESIEDWGSDVELFFNTNDLDVVLKNAPKVVEVQIDKTIGPISFGDNILLMGLM